MNIASKEFFYCHFVGYTPDVSIDVHKTTQAMIDHLADSSMPLETLFDVFEECAADGYISPSNLPKYLWNEGNLIDHNKVYIHKNLVIRSAAPSYDIQKNKLISSPYFFENIEYYNMQNLLEYAYDKLEIYPTLQDHKRDLGILRFYLLKYKDLPIPVLDFLLFLIDINSENLFIKSLNNIRQFEVETFNMLQERISNLQANDLYKIVWRQY